VIGLPPAKRVWVLAPHPDDEALGCGGTIRLYVEQDIPVTVVVLTDGAQLASQTENLASLRREEAEAAARTLGYGRPVFLNLPDGKLSQFAQKVKSMLQGTERPPDLLLAPSLLDVHPDHVATAKIAAQLAKRWAQTRVAYYSVYQPIRPNCFVPIGPVEAKKELAIAAYQRSLLGNAEMYQLAVKHSNASWAFQTACPGLYEPFLIATGATTTREIIDWILCRGPLTLDSNRPS
jgi:LmbE family N-acetylglucosaminyl deacetylase